MNVKWIDNSILFIDVSYVKCVRCPSRPLFCLQREKHSIRSFTKLREVIQINTNGRSNYWFVLCSDQNTHWKHEEQENLEHTKSRKRYNRLETEYCNIPYRYVCETHFFGEGRCIHRQSLSAKPPSKLDAERKEPGQFIERADPPGAFAQLLLIEIQG